MSFRVDQATAKKEGFQEVILKHISGNYFVILHLLSIELILLMHAFTLRKTGCNQSSSRHSCFLF